MSNLSTQYPKILKVLDLYVTVKLITLKKKIHNDT